MIDIISVEDKKNSKGPWLVLNYKNEKGEDKKTNIFGDLCGQYKGPGKYEVAWVKKGDYYNIKTMEAVAESSRPSNGNGASHASVTATEPANRSGEIKANINNAAFLAASGVVAAMIRQGFFSKENKGEITDYTVGMANIFRIESVEWIKGKAVPLSKVLSQTEGA